MRIRTVILCGGKGTRAYPATASVPKPLLDVGGQPVVRHVMAIFAAQGFTDFVLAAGYKCALLEEFASTLAEPWRVEVIDTGEATKTGERVRRVANVVSDTFFLTYGDGLANVDLAAALRFHQSHPGVATMTAVPMPSQYGTVEFDSSGSVERFDEKPNLSDHYINGGFFVFDTGCYEKWPDPGDDLERDVLPAFARSRELFARRHDGFWKSMDTYKDALELSSMCAEGVPPWLQPIG